MVIVQMELIQQGKKKTTWGKDKQGKVFAL